MRFPSETCFLFESTEVWHAALPRPRRLLPRDSTEGPLPDPETTVPRLSAPHPPPAPGDLGQQTIPAGTRLARREGIRCVRLALEVGEDGAPVGDAEVMLEDGGEDVPAVGGREEVPAFEEPIGGEAGGMRNPSRSGICEDRSSAIADAAMCTRPATPRSPGASPRWSPSSRDSPATRGTLGRAKIVRLPPDGRVLPHRDRGDYYAKRDRYHLVLDSPGSWMRCGDEEVTMREGELWWFDNKEKHEVRNGPGRARSLLQHRLLGSPPARHPAGAEARQPGRRGPHAAVLRQRLHRGQPSAEGSPANLAHQPSSPTDHERADQDERAAPLRGGGRFRARELLGALESVGSGAGRRLRRCAKPSASRPFRPWPQRRK